ncbi:MAG: hypothetical protein OQK58_13670, partial [Gammaproteobacteria bacterium]|nr:hypothetical protein [Gammaproteobacteria bacterium]
MNRNNHPSDFKHHTQYFLLRVLNILFLRLYNSLRQLGLVTVYLVFLFFSFNYNVNAGLLTKLDPVSEATPYALTFFPFADSLGTFDGDPESAAVYSDNKLVGYVFFTDHVMPIPGYSGKPMHTLVGFDLTGKITGIEIVSHEEPILLAGVSEQDLLDFKNQYLGFNANQRSQVGG